MLVNTKKIKALNPCKDRLDHHMTNNAGFSGTMSAFLDLSTISHEEKLWIFFNLINKKYVRFVAADFAEQVLHIYESKYPNDDRPRKGILTARAKKNDVANFDIQAASDAARSAFIASFAAHASSDSATYAADAAAAAADTATYSIRGAHAAACANACAAADSALAADKKTNQAITQIQIMKKYAIMHNKKKGK